MKPDDYMTCDVCGSRVKRGGIRGHQKTQGCVAALVILETLGRVYIEHGRVYLK